MISTGNINMIKNKTNERPCIRTTQDICYDTIDYEALDPYIKCNKWNCFHGPHNPAYFNNLTNTGDVQNSINSGEPKKKKNLPGIRHFTKEPWRPFHWDRGGIRKMDAKPSPYYQYNSAQYQEKAPTEPYVKTNIHSLLRYHQGLMDFEPNHPSKLLNTYLYRKVILPHEGAEKCDDELELEKNEEDKFKSKDLLGSTMSNLDIWRLRFLGNNYMTFDDWS